MKKIFVTLILSLIISKVYCQSEDWIFQVVYNPTDECIDSTQCFTEIIMNVNLATVPDSAQIITKIGTISGADDILSKSYLNAPSIYTLKEVEQQSNEVISISSGKYLNAASLYVDLIIEP